MIKLFKNLKPYLLPIIGVIVLIFIQSMSELYLPTLMGDIVDEGIAKQNIPYIWKTGGLMVLVTIGGTLAALLASFLASRVGTGFGRDLRNKVFRKVESYSLHEFDEISTPSLITRTTNDITQVQNVATTILRMFVRAPMMAVGGIIMAVTKDAKLSLILVGVVIALAIIIGIVAKVSIPLFKSMQNKIDKLNMVMRERLSGVRVIRAFNRVSNEKDKFKDANYDLTDTTIKVNKIMALLMPLMMLLMNITTIAIIWFASYRIDAGALQVGDLMAFIQYVMQIMFGLVMLTMLFVMVPRASVSAVRINEVLDKDPDIKDTNNVVSFKKEGHLEFKNVSFRYHGAEEYAIENISFEAKPGQVTAIVGGTGAGKTTLVNMIPRFYDVSEGEVLLNGQPIQVMSQKQLREKIGFVPQKAVLFTGTIKDNIEFGSDGYSDEKIEKAITTAQAKEFVDQMEKGLDSEIAQGGTNVSGGQKQRLSIARALAKEPEIYVFDDSFSALDFKTDAKLRKALEEETKEGTVLIVAQRITTVMNADQILVLDNGKILARGTHSELLNSSDVYREIVYSQMSEEEIS
jgi:ATP-binding cassette subfamily B protein